MGSLARTGCRSRTDGPTVGDKREAHISRQTRSGLRVPPLGLKSGHFRLQSEALFRPEADSGLRRMGGVAISDRYLLPQRKTGGKYAVSQGDFVKSDFPVITSDGQMLFHPASMRLKIGLSVICINQDLIRQIDTQGSD